MTIRTPSLLMIGCGAVAELLYAPALRQLEREGAIKVTALFDPAETSIAAMRSIFPRSRAVSDLEQALRERAVDMAVVCSPPRWHAEQTIAALNAGVSVLCEKPMAPNVSECRQMIDAARSNACTLAIGQIRRFYPAARFIHELVSSGSLGPVTSFSIAEGHRFGWPTRTGSFFQKQQSGGGVLLDIGAHVFDLLCWWFGQPIEVVYHDDAMGGVEANCRVMLCFKGEDQNFARGELSGSVRLSREHSFLSRYEIEFENGCLTWSPYSVDQVKLTLAGVTADISGSAIPGSGVSPVADQGRTTLGACFTAQVKNFMAVVSGTAKLTVTAEEVMNSIQLIEQCYANRQLLPMKWLGEQEVAAAQRLQKGDIEC